jgi:hypothetical protein
MDYIPFECKWIRTINLKIIDLPLYLLSYTFLVKMISSENKNRNTDEGLFVSFNFNHK